MEFIDRKTIKLDKEINDLDRFALDFITVAKKYTNYVIISGYVAILFGRSRGTEDIDMFLQEMTDHEFSDFFRALEKNGFDCITADRVSAYENLCEDVPIRFARHQQFLPNVEVKFARRELDRTSLQENLLVKTSIGDIKISKLEPQIAFKEVILASEKDLEDAAHLRNVFKGHLDLNSIDDYKRYFKSVL